jgi:hypothetical protein
MKDCLLLILAGLGFFLVLPLVLILLCASWGQGGVFFLTALLVGYVMIKSN